MVIPNEVVHGEKLEAQKNEQTFRPLQPTLTCLEHTQVNTTWLVSAPRIIYENTPNTIGLLT
jgi:hypothetical protein